MCGIYGFASNDLNCIPDESFLTTMGDPLVSRGPDDFGIFIAPGVGLGHRRLKVIDLVTGQQPMTDASGRFSIVFNGEIYNYLELREQLRARGSVFCTESDTEVLLQGLALDGLRFLDSVNGMFAFGLWDARERELLLVRDRFGVKPLYYMESSKGLYFASEASALIATGQSSGEIDGESLGLYMALSYLPGQNGMIKGIKRLLPGGWLRFKAERGCTHGRWWRLADRWKTLASAAVIRDAKSWEDELYALLDDSVRIRLKSNVPLGAFLSSGIDSSCVVALMKKHLPDVNTFTMVFDDRSHNEADGARKTAELLATKHTEYLADFGGFQTLRQIASSLDEPCADTSIIPTYLLCKNARRHVTVALSGDGADELLAGYITHQANTCYSYLRRLPKSLVRLLQLAVHCLPDNHDKVNFVFKLKQFLGAYPRSPELAHASWRLLFAPKCLDSLLAGGGGIAGVFAQFQRAWDDSEGLPVLDRFLYMDYETWLAWDILVKMDRASMGNSLEVRSPFLDYRLFELCAKMPAKMKRDHGTGKIVLRRAARRLLPASVIDRPKQGFNAPVARWFCEDWREESEARFAQVSRERDGIDREKLSAIWTAHSNGRKNFGFQLFSILMYLLWKDEHKL